MYGKSIVQVLSKELQKEFPGAKGYSAANLRRMRNFYLTYRESEKLAPMVREISWSNNVVIMEKCKDDLQSEFYIQMTKRYGWTKRVLTNFVEAQTYEKYLLNQTNFALTLPAERRVQAKLAVKDEYTFDFAELSPEYSEHVNIVQIMTYYSLGRWIVETQQMGEKRAKYGSKVIKTLLEKLQEEFGKGFSEDTLKNARKFYLTYKERISETVFSFFEKEPPFIVSWSHYLQLMRMCGSQEKVKTELIKGTNLV